MMWRVAIAGFLTVCLAFLQPPSRAQFNGCQAGFCAPKAAGAASYTGPGDIVTFTTWYGIRAYSSATRGTKAINVCNVSDVACADLSTDGTTGKLTVTTIGGSDCSMVTCTIKTWYDKVGTDDCTQATIATRATLLTSGGPGGSFAAGGFARASSQTYTCGVTPGGIAQPFSISSVAERTGTTGSFNTIFGFGGDMLFNNAANGCGIYAGTVLVDTTHCPDSAYHAIQGLYNGATSSTVIDGNTAVTGNAGTAAPGGAFTIGNGAGGLLDGRMLEVGIATGNQSANFNSLNSNQHGANGYNF